MPTCIFQSYSHHDWQPIPPFGRSRLQDFIEAVQKELNTGDKRSGMLWMRDEEGRIRYGDKIDVAVEAAIEECDMGVIVLSKAFVGSENCTYEFDLLIASGKPVFLVQIEPIASELIVADWNGRLGDIENTLTCCLFDETRDAPGRETRIGYPIPLYDEKNIKRFYDLALHLANDISLRARAIDHQNPNQNNNLPSNEEQETIDVLLLAPCPELETQQAADDLIALLDNQDLDVVRLNEETVDPERLMVLIPRARVVAQIFGIMAGRRIVDVPLTQAQFEQSSRLDKRPLAWLTPTARKLEHLDVSYRDFVEQTEYDTRSLEEYAKTLQRLAMAAREQEALIEQYDIPPGNAVVVIDAHSDDWDTGQIFQENVENGARQVIDNIIVRFIENDKGGFRDTKRLLDCAKIHAVLLLYGPSRLGRSRLSERLPEYCKRVALQRQRTRETISALAIGDPCSPNVPPSPSGNAGGHVIHKLRLIDGATEPDATSEFIEHVRVVAEAI